MDLSEKLKNFINIQTWIFAKTYAETWPHEYIVQEKVDSDLFQELANHIDKFGYKKYFQEVEYTYFDYDDFTYWHIENIINRCEIKAN